MNIFCYKLILVFNDSLHVVTRIQLNILPTMYKCTLFSRHVHTLCHTCGTIISFFPFCFCLCRRQITPTQTPNLTDADAKSHQHRCQITPTHTQQLMLLLYLLLQYNAPQKSWGGGLSKEAGLCITQYHPPRNLGVSK